VAAAALADAAATNFSVAANAKIYSAAAAAYSDAAVTVAALADAAMAAAAMAAAAIAAATVTVTFDVS
jgi:hypothetical protein